MTQSQQDRPKIINAGLFRMATKSMAQAYTILGFKTHHGLLESVYDTPWALLEQAAEATWPHVPSARPRAPFTRADWDAIWGSYDAVTDLASPFAPQLVEAYPAAKVVVVQRAFEDWWPSYRTELLEPVTRQPMAAIQKFVTNHVLGLRAIHAMQKVHFGFFDARDRREVEAHAWEAYERYFETLRKMVPPERRLEYQVGSGWEPLCKFLGVAVPDVPFPRANEREMHAKEVESRQKGFFVASAKLVLPWLLGAAVIGAAAWMYS
ncbi:hypothetical protein F5B19DRAFT_485606 [Rostrohypoxylon terebratum]|nr:hypothetical protein F5B19DRAFT_485606 [Rostrohypoxylon terebratum]